MVALAMAVSCQFSSISRGASGINTVVPDKLKADVPGSGHGARTCNAPLNECADFGAN